ncbi:mitochondrial carrier [Epithele typhae]|uniref:mitochondrial carrier n=1 Tax=Epithele typhae TaxID=378194 RepID=UPI0020088EB8|nr:mitochondrial carrier [Epithele typhae]KAH9925618.1 mitochondrial carrier [Epithele typhae]
MSDAFQRKPLPFIANFTAGAIAGISEILTFYPLDVVKTRMQLATGRSKMGVVTSFRTIIREEGYVRPFVPWLGAPLLMEAPKRATKFAANDFWGKSFLSLTGKTKMDQSLATATGCMAGVTESVVVVPFELVKIKCAAGQVEHLKGPLDVIKQVVAKDGLLGLYAGMEATMWRHLWWNGGYFGSIFQVRAMLPKPESNSQRLTNDLIAGTIGGTIGTVIKSRIQSVTKVPGVVPKYNWTYPALVTMAREEGLASLYKGFVPKVMRLAPGGGLLLLVVEATLNMFRQALGPPYI